MDYHCDKRGRGDKPCERLHSGGLATLPFQRDWTGVGWHRLPFPLINTPSSGGVGGMKGQKKDKNEGEMTRTNKQKKAKRNEKEKKETQKRTEEKNKEKEKKSNLSVSLAINNNTTVNHRRSS
jgi:hypothetical protein